MSQGPSPAVDFLAGTAGGVASLLVGQPFDTIKTRLQAQRHDAVGLQCSPSGANPAASSSSTPLLRSASPHGSTSTTTTTSGTLQRQTYKSATDAFRIIVRDEKFFGLFKGVTSPMLGVAAMNACIFGSYGWALRLQQQQSSGSSRDGASSSSVATLALPQPTLNQILLAGCASGIVSALVTSPIELVKIREQLDYSGVGARPRPIQVVKQIWSQGGLRGLYRGLGATCVRDLGYGPYFLCYEIINRLLLSMHEATPMPGEIIPAPGLSNLEYAFSGAVAGVLAWVSTFPIDCIKTRVQAVERLSGEGQRQRGWRPWNGSVAVAASEIWRQGGAGAFWRGVGATVLRAIPVNATLFVVYEGTKDALIRSGW